MAQRNYWTKEKIISEYIDFIVKHKFTYYPSHREISDNGRSDLKNAIFKFFGYENFKTIIKEKGITLNPTRSNSNKWNEQTVISELKIVIAQLGYFPSINDFNKLNKNDLRGAINKFGGANKFIKILHTKSKSEFRNIKPSGYWVKWDNVERELKYIYNLLNRFPTKKDFIGLGYERLYNGLKYHGSISVVAEKMGYSYKRQNQYITLDGDFVLSIYEVLFDNFLYLNNIKHTTNKVINTNTKYRYDFLINCNDIDYYIEIWGLSNANSTRSKKYDKKRIKKETFYKKHNLTLLSVEPNIFDGDYFNIYDNIKNLFITNNIKTNNFYESKDYIDLFMAEIYSYDRLQIELKPYIQYYDGFMPTASFLTKHGGGRLITKIRKLGGFNVVKERLKLKSNPKILRYIKKNNKN